MKKKYFKKTKYFEDKETPDRKIISSINHGKNAPMNVDPETKSSARDYVENLISKIKDKFDTENIISDEKLAATPIDSIFDVNKDTFN